MRALIVGVLAALLLQAAPASAHPTPFSYFDIHVNDDSIEVSLIAHMIDIAHDLNVDPPERLLKSDQIAIYGNNITTMLAARFRLQADGTALSSGQWSTPVALPERQSLQMTARFTRPSAFGIFRLDTLMFPYDPLHQTFVNIYEGDTLALQAILDQSKTSVEFFTGSRQGTTSLVRRFVALGARHILLGPEHLLFLFGVLLLGGTPRQLATIVSAFVVGHCLTLTLGAFNILNPPGRLIEPAIALAIVYVGADNLMVRDGKDLRLWIAFGFGCIHGFGFANLLRAMDLPRRATTWSIASFGIGAEVAQLLVAAVVSMAFAAVLARNARLHRKVIYAGSILVIAGGAFWFIQRVFFPDAFA
ncbi:MAG: HupE/UreJ family protein [Vicinamibacterales bacterium]